MLKIHEHFNKFNKHNKLSNEVAISNEIII
jgi:hypothetical protein